MSPAFFETGGFVFQRYFFSSKMGHFGHLNRWVLFKWCHSSGVIQVDVWVVSIFFSIFTKK